MKIADSESIKAGEQELINSIMKKLDSEIIESLAAKSIALGSMEFRKGDMVIHDDKIVYKMDFQATIGLSVMFDREGNIVFENGADEPVTEEEEISETVPIEDTSDFSGEEEKLPACDTIQSEVAEDNEMSLVLQKTRDYWLEKSSEASVVSNSSDEGSEEEDLEAVLQRNREYWESQTT